MQTRVLKFLVIFLAVLILLGFTVVVLTIAHRLKQGDGSAAPAQPGIASLALPSGASVLDMVGAGENRVALRVILADGSQAILLVDAATGRLVETTNLTGGRKAEP